MKVLIVGGGGREHAIAQSVAKSEKVDKIYCTPGNAGIAALAECAPIGAMEFDKIVAFAKEKEVDLVIVGMDDPLVGGLVDELEAEGIRAFGPKKNAAILIYKAFSEEGAEYNVYKNEIQFLDNDTNNTAFENLQAIPKSIISKNCSYGDQFKQQIVDDYKRGDLSMRQLAEKYHCSLTSVQKFIGYTYQREYRKRITGTKG